MLWWAGMIEMVPGFLLATGLFTRTAAFLAAGEMAVYRLRRPILPTLALAG